tara:strand:+ start:74 stop:562 length:489 start_codon:yes stop_codon:yes gene_type:complete
MAQNAGQTADQITNASANTTIVGPETNMPIPRFASLNASEANVRRGPSLTQRIDWIFQRRGMPLQIIAEYGHWRRVIDRDGQGGWVHYRMISGARTVIVDQDMLALRAKPDVNARENAELEQGVIAKIEECGPLWCKLSTGGYRGWAQKSALWGVQPDEILE